jgi:hypothetical protein
MAIDWSPILEALILALIQSGMIQDLITIIINWLKSLTPAQQVAVLNWWAKNYSGIQLPE